jgi:hypothetical protein
MKKAAPKGAAEIVSRLKKRKLADAIMEQKQTAADDRKLAI